MAQRWTKQNNTGSAPADSEQEGPPLRPPESSSKLWAQAKAEDVNPEYLRQGSGWYALFNPDLVRSLDVSLAYELTHTKCVSSSSSMIYTNKIRSSSILLSTVLCVRFSPDGRYLGIGYDDGTAQVCDTSEGVKTWLGQLTKLHIRSLISMHLSKRYADESSEGPTYSVCFSPDGTHLATAGGDKRIRVSYGAFA